jgi:hypothetical protein
VLVSWIWNWDKLGRFPSNGEISKYRYKVKNFNEMGKNFGRERFRIAVAEIPPVPGQVRFRETKLHGGAHMGL